MTTRARHAASLAALMVTLGADRLSAAEPACAAIAVETDPDASARWPDLPERVREALGGRDDVDACARITITQNRATRATIVLEVFLPDGRSAVRAVLQPEDVVPTLEALLLLPRERARAEDPPEARTTATATATAAATLQPPSAAGASAIASRHAEPPKSATGPPRAFRLEFSLATGAHVGDGHVGASLGALTFFDVAGWLVGFEGAAHRYKLVAGDADTDGLALAVLLGRRFRFHAVSVNLTAGPAVALPGIGSRFSAMAAGDVPMAPVVRQSAVDRPSTRLRCGARLTFRPRSLLRTFAGIDADFGARADAGLAPEEPRLPSWTVGLVVGATVGTP